MELQSNSRLDLLQQVVYLIIAITLLIPFQSFAQSQDSRAGDEAALEAIYRSTNGDQWDNRTGWSSSGMSLSDDIYGVEVENVDGELRVVSIKLNGTTGWKQQYIEGATGQFGGNNLTGRLPEEIGNLTKIEYFNVKQNYISGSIPSSIGNMVSLRHLALNGQTSDLNDIDAHHPGKAGGNYADERSNNFTGDFPASVGNLTNLEYLEITGRGEPGDGLDSMPSSINNLVNLKGLHFGNNKLQSLPDLSNLTDMRNISMGYQDYQGNISGDDFTGLIGDGFPQWLGNMDKLVAVWFEHCDGIGGTLPDMSGATDLEIFSVTWGDITGPFPEYMIDGSMPNINMIQLTWNDLTGSFPEISSPNNLAMLSLDGNELSGSIPASWGTSAAAKVINFGFGWNDLSGDLPDFDQMYQLRYIRANGNNFTGTIPLLNASNTSLTTADFQNNQMSGTIRAELAEIAKLPKMNGGDFRIDGNQFTQSDMQPLIDALEEDGNLNVLKYDGQNPDSNTDSTPPEAPNPNSPDNGATGTSLTPILDWSTATDASSYRLQIAESSDFGAVLADKSGLSSTEYETDSLGYGSTYYWRVRASNSNGSSDWSNAHDFTTKEEPVSVAVPTLTSPSDNQESVSVSTTFDWQSIDGADYYILHVSRIKPSEMVIVDTVYSNTYRPDQSLDVNTTYDWRVRAGKDGEMGEWSEIWRFSTISQSTFSKNIHGPEGMRLLTSPVMNTTLKELLGSLWNQGADGSDAPGAAPNIFAWNEKRQVFESPSDMTEEMVPGKGYLVWIFEDDDPSQAGVQGGFPKQISVEGEENSSPVSVPISVTDDNNSYIIDGQEGWNMIGNPYGAPIHVDAILQAARQLSDQVNSNLYIWEPSSSNGGGSYVNLPEGEGHTIEPFQVFWLRYMAPVEGSITLDKADLTISKSRLADNSVGSTLSNPVNESSGVIKVKLDQQNSSDEVALKFCSEGKVGIDLKDAYKLDLNPMATETTNELFLIEGEGKEESHLSTSVLPDTLNSQLNVKVGLRTSEGDARLSWTGLTNIPENWTALLEDTHENRITDMRLANSYSFTSSSGSDNSRFKINIVPSAASAGATEPVDKPQKISLLQNYPNPFNPSTQIKYTVDQESEVNLTVYNMIGRKVATLISDKVQNQGTYTVQFDANRFTSGVYIYRLEIDGKVLAKKMTLIK